MIKRQGSVKMADVIKVIMSPNRKFKVEIIKRPDQLFTVMVFRWIEWEDDYSYKYWSLMKQGLSLIDPEGNAIKIAIEQLMELSGEEIEIDD